MTLVETIRAALEALAARADYAVPETGGFEAVDRSFEVPEPGWTQGSVVLRLGATPRITATGTEPSDQRYLQVRVASPGGGSETSQLVGSGSKDEVLALARDAALPERIVSVMRDLAETQRRFQLP